MGASLALALLAAVTVQAAPFFCGQCFNGGAPPMSNTRLDILCPSGSVIETVQFASYGTATGTCGSYAVGTCNAPNSTSVVEAACIGNQACSVWPNSTTFGDPCFGTVKQLVVQLTCSGGALGSTACANAPPSPSPAPLPPSNASVAVSVDWSAAPITAFKQDISVQVVAQKYLFRNDSSTPQQSAIYNNSWAAVKALQARRVRFAAWFPYAKAGVAELDPPSGSALCGPAAWSVGGQTRPFTLTCRNSTISAIDFASFGTPSGVCGNYSLGACHVPNSLSIAQAACVGRESCALDPAAFGGSNACPSSNQAPYLAVQARCADASLQHTYWNFEDVFVPYFSDFYDAVDGGVSSPIISYSTAPTWLFSPEDYVYQDDPLRPDYSYEKGKSPALNGTALGDYYGRLYAYLTKGRFTDEYGNVVSIPPATGRVFNLSDAVIEVGNEVDYEHGYDVEGYTRDFDATVRGIRRWAGDALGNVPFNGLNLPNIDDTPTVASWARYFLNETNHAPDVRDDAALAYIGYHAYPTNGGFTPDPTSFSRMFDYIDTLFVPKVLALDAVIASTRPGTRTLLDECGVDMDAVLPPPPAAPPANNPRFWVASGAYFAYLVSSVAALPGTTVRQIGHSQVMDAPGQEPSVSLLDWTSGNGTAAYWATWLLIRAFTVGDQLLPANVTGSGSDGVHARAWLHTPAPPGRPDLPGASRALPSSQRLLLVNKRNAWASVALPSASASGVAGGASGACTAWVVDERNGLLPPTVVDCTGARAQLQLWPYATAVVEL